MNTSLEQQVSSQCSGNSRRQNREEEFIEPVNPLSVKKREKFFHPYAQQQSPREKIFELLQDFAESLWFFIYEALAFILDRLWALAVMTFCVPVAGICLFFDKLR
jgi:hypothetical protein